MYFQALYQNDKFTEEEMHNYRYNYKSINVKLLSGTFYLPLTII